MRIQDNKINGSDATVMNPQPEQLISRVIPLLSGPLKPENFKNAITLCASSLGSPVIYIGDVSSDTTQMHCLLSICEQNIAFAGEAITLHNETDASDSSFEQRLHQNLKSTLTDILPLGDSTDLTIISSADHNNEYRFIAVTNTATEKRIDYRLLLDIFVENLQQYYKLSARKSKNAANRELLEHSQSTYGTWRRGIGWHYHNVNGFAKLGFEKHEIDLTSFESSNPISPEDLKKLIPKFEKCITEGENYDFLFEAIGKKDERQWFKTESRVAETDADGNTKLITSISYNVTDIKHAENTIKGLADHEKWMVGVTTAIYQCIQFSDFDAVLSSIAKRFDCNRASLRLVDPQTSLSSVVSEYHDQDLTSLKIMFPELTKLSTASWVKNLLEKGKIHKFYDIEEDLDEGYIKTFYRDISSRAIATAPTLENGQLTGMLSILKDHPHRWTKEELKILETLAICVQLAIERIRLLDELRTSDERFKLSVDHSTLGMWDYGKDNSEVYLSPKYFEMLGYEEGELAHAPDTTYKNTHPDDRHLLSIDSQINSLMQQDYLDIETRNIAKDGSIFWVNTKGKVISRDEKGAPTRVIGIATDITEQKNTLSLLKELRAVAEKANKSKSEFLERMSHEIRTPMNAILGMAYLALDSGLDESQTNNVKDIESAGKSLLHIIDDILDFSKIESGELEIKYEPFNLRSEIKRITKLFSLRAEENNNDLTFTIADDIPNWLIGDKHRLGQVLINLVSNAIKFTKNGTIAISAQFAGRDKKFDTTSILFSVKDSGIGLTAQQISRLFKPYEQGEDSTTRKYGGTGLGLSICKYLVEMMGGTIEVISLPEVGTTFHFTITLKHPNKQELANTQVTNLDEKALTESHSKTLTVLLVEDNIVNQKVAQGLLNKFKVNHITANNGREALDILAKSAPQNFDAILMDIEMPVLNGLETTKAIRELPIWKHIPIVAMTAHAMVGDRERCENAGMDLYVPKPINPDNLQSALQQIQQWDAMP